jgi:hypothetical protein
VRRLAAVLLLLVPLAAAAQEAQTILHLLDYIGVDYGEAVEGGKVDRLEWLVGGIGHGPAGAAERRFLAALSVRLGRAPMDVVATARVHAAHVDALDGAGLGALEAGLALQRAVLVVQGACSMMPPLAPSRTRP